MSDRAVRVAGWAGIVFVVLILIGIFGGGSPAMPDDSIDKIRSAYVDHRTALLVTNVLNFFGIPFALWFAVVLRDLLAGDRMARILANASLAGLLVTAPMAMVGGIFTVAPVYVDGAAKTMADDTLRIMLTGQFLAFGATSAGILLFVLAAGLGIRRTSALPAYTMWLAWLAVVGNAVALFSELGAGATG